MPTPTPPVNKNWRITANGTQANVVSDIENAVLPATLSDDEKLGVLAAKAAANRRIAGEAAKGFNYFEATITNMDNTMGDNSNFDFRVQVKAVKAKL